MDLGGKDLRRRLQDTRRAPFRRKIVDFPWLHTGAAVDERAARKEKPCNINASYGTMRLYGQTSARP